MLLQCANAIAFAVGLTAAPPAVVEAVERYSNVEDIALVLAVIAAESSFAPQAMSNKDAKGLMQMTPIAVADVQGRCGLTGNEDVWSVKGNVRLGTCFLDKLLREYEGDVVKALVHYNAGGKYAVRPQDTWPSETKAYVNKTIKLKEKCDVLANN